MHHDEVLAIGPDRRHISSCLQALRTNQAPAEPEEVPERYHSLYVKDEHPNWYYPGEESITHPGNPSYHLFICKYDIDILCAQTNVEIWADGTFSIKHKQFAQVLILHCKITYDREEDRFISFPFLFCLCESKSQNMYTSISV